MRGLRGAPLTALGLVLWFAGCGDKDGDDSGQTGDGGAAGDGGGGDGGGAAGDGGGGDGGGAGDGGGVGDGGGAGDGGGVGACPSFFPADREGATWTLRTTYDDGSTETWTQQVMPQEDGRFVMRTVLGGTTTDQLYTCGGEGQVELHGARSAGGSYAADMTYDPPMLVWPGGEPTPMTWASLGSVGGTWSAGGGSGAITGSYQATWTVEEVGLSWKLDGEDVPGCYRWRRAAQDIILSSTTENDEIGLTCGDMVGLAWNDVVTTTTVSGSPPLVAESSTTLLSVHLP